MTIDIHTFKQGDYATCEVCGSYNYTNGIYLVCDDHDVVVKAYVLCARCEEDKRKEKK